MNALESCKDVLLDDTRSDVEKHADNARPVRPTLDEIFDGSLGDRENRNLSVMGAYLTHGYNLREIGNYPGMSVSGIAKIVHSRE